MTVPAKSASGDIMESVIIAGDLAKLTPEDRTRYYTEVCKSLGLNPLTQPFSYIHLNGKLTLYATRACTDQLRKINSITLEIVSRDITDDILTIHVRAKTPEGRSDEDLGAVYFPATLKGDARVNAELKCITKAKRRTTLSICGLGWLDETEIEIIPSVAKHEAIGGQTKSPAADSTAPAAPATLRAQDEAGAITLKPPNDYPLDPSDDIITAQRIWDEITTAAQAAPHEGYNVFVDCWNKHAKAWKNKPEIRNRIAPHLQRFIDIAKAKPMQATADTIDSKTGEVLS